MSAHPRGKPQAYVDSDGYVYPTKRGGGGTVYALIFGVLCMLIGAFGVMHRLGIPYEEALAPLPTAGVMPSTPPAVRVNLEQQSARQSAPAAPASDYGIATYNADQQARATALQATQEAPGATEATQPDNEAAIEAWLAAPVSTATPLPEPGAPGFAESFSDAPECSPFIGYVAGSDCARFFATQTAEAEE